MQKVFALYTVGALLSEQLLGMYSTFEKAEEVAVSIALHMSMERFNNVLWVDSVSWGTVYIKEFRLDYFAPDFKERD